MHAFIKVESDIGNGAPFGVNHIPPGHTRIDAVNAIRRLIEVLDRQLHRLRTQPAIGVEVRGQGSKLAVLTITAKALKRPREPLTPGAELR